MSGPRMTMTESVCLQFKNMSIDELKVEGRKLAEDMDAKDTLAQFRSEFLFPQSIPSHLH